MLPVGGINLVVIKTLSSNHRIYNHYTKIVKILEISKQFSENLVNETDNVPRRGALPMFSDLEVVALSLTAETESIDSENINCKSTRTAFPISYQGDSSMTAERKRQTCVRNCARGLPWKWMAEKNNSLLTASQ